MASLSAGARLGPYEILGPLGVGGMGEVWRARDAKLARDVAIKVLPAELAADPGRLKRFEKEAQSASGLNHPNIVTIYDFGKTDETSWIAMELVVGKSLRELLAGGALPLRRLLGIAAQVADGLARAHDAGIVHRDLKPENVMVTKDGLVKILDFGLAKVSHPGIDGGQPTEAPTVSLGTTPGVVMGTVGYMSPEQASGHPVDFRSDQFSLGSMLYEMATGKPAFKRGTTAQTLAAIIQDEPEPVAAINPKVAPPLRWIIEQCHAKEAGGRYASTEDLARDLARVRDHLSETSAAIEASVATRPRSRLGSGYVLAAFGLLAGVAVGAMIFRQPPAEQPRFHRLNFRLEPLGFARFAPDGQTIVYGAAWKEGGATQLFSTRADSTESTPLAVREAELLSISSSGMMAISLWRRNSTLAEVSLAGGAPREIAEGVNGADWSADGRSLAVTRKVGSRFRLEFPVGKVLYESRDAELGCPRFSPDGKLIAFVDGGDIATIDLAGKRTTLSSGWWPIAIDLAWHPKTGELWFSGREGSGRDYGALYLHAVSRSGRHRVVLKLPANQHLQDISRDGRVLLQYTEYPQRLMCLPPGSDKEVDLSWLDLSGCTDLSDDGKSVLIYEFGTVGTVGVVYLRRTDGSPAVRLGEGNAEALSPDGKWAIVIPESGGLTLLPTGAGEPRLLRQEGLRYDSARWFPGGNRILFSATVTGHPTRLYVQDVTGGAPRVLTPEGFEIGPVSPDGRLVATRGPDGTAVLYPIEGGEPKPLAGVFADDGIIRWDSRGEALFLAKGSGIHFGIVPPLRIDKLILSTGRRELWKEIIPPDPSTVVGMDVRLTPDGRFYAYSFMRELSSLHVVDGLR